MRIYCSHLFCILHQRSRALAILRVLEMREFAEASLISGAEHLAIDRQYVLETARNAKYISQVLQL